MVIDRRLNIKLTQYPASRSLAMCYHLDRVGVHVIMVKADSVDARMAWGRTKLPFAAPPEATAQDACKVWPSRKNVVHA